MWRLARKRKGMECRFKQETYAYHGGISRAFSPSPPLHHFGVGSPPKLTDVLLENGGILRRIISRCMSGHVVKLDSQTPDAAQSYQRGSSDTTGMASPRGHPRTTWTSNKWGKTQCCQQTYSMETRYKSTGTDSGLHGPTRLAVQ